jgi:hypothetical protein
MIPFHNFGLVAFSVYPFGRVMMPDSRHSKLEELSQVSARYPISQSSAI